VPLKKPPSASTSRSNVAPTKNGSRVSLSCTGRPKPCRKRHEPSSRKFTRSKMRRGPSSPRSYSARRFSPARPAVCRTCAGNIAPRSASTLRIAPHSHSGPTRASASRSASSRVSICLYPPATPELSASPASGIPTAGNRGSPARLRASCGATGSASACSNGAFMARRSRRPRAISTAAFTMRPRAMRAWCGSPIRRPRGPRLSVLMIGIGIELTGEARDLPVGRPSRNQRIVPPGKKDHRLIRRQAHHMLKGQQSDAALRS
jgi:hypothetical protein